MTSHEPKIDVICEGDAREMGFAQGAAMREKIRDARRILAALEAFRLQQPLWMPYWLYRRIAESKSQRFLAQALTDSFQASFSRLEGIANGAQLPWRTICLFNALEPLLSSVAGCTACPGACSSVAVTRARTVNGEPIVAHNFDYLPLVQPLYMLRECRPHEKLRSLEFTTAPLAGTVDGINEAGLSIAYDYAFAVDSPATPAPPISLAISHALSHCRTVDDAATTISNFRRCGGGLLMLADATGAIASLELSSTRSCLRRPESGQDVLFHTNAFSTETMRAVQIPDDAVYDSHAPTPLRGRRLHESSDCRDARFRTLLKEAGRLDADGVAGIMSDHGAEAIAGDYTPCVHGSYWFTTATLQFVPHERRMRVAYDSACQARYTDFVL